MRRYPGRPTITLIVLCQSLQSLTVGGLSLFLPLIREDLGLSFTQAGLITGAATLVFALMQIPAGALADRFGPKRLFVIGLLGVSVLSFGFALLDSYVLLLVNQAMSGFFRALVFIPGLLLITSEFPSNRRATAMGLYVAGGFSSNIVLSTLGPILVGPLGWRTLFVVFSLSGVAIVAGYWLVGDVGPAARGAGALPLRHLRVLLRHRVLWIAGWVQFVRFAVVNGTTFWLPTYLVLDKGFSLQTAGLIVALGSILTAPANFLGGYVSDRLGAPARVGGVSGTGLAGTLLLLVHVHSLLAVTLVVALQSVFVQIYFGPLFQIPITVLGEPTAGLSNGFSNLCANLGGLGATYALGSIRDATDSFALGFSLLAALCISAIGGAVLLGRIRPLGAPAREMPRPAGSAAPGSAQPRI